jgi:hypothetical protein
MPLILPLLLPLPGSDDGKPQRTRIIAACDDFVNTSMLSE